MALIVKCSTKDATHALSLASQIPDCFLLFTHVFAFNLTFSHQECSAQLSHEPKGENILTIRRLVIYDPLPVGEAHLGTLFGLIQGPRLKSPHSGISSFCPKMTSTGVICTPSTKPDILENYYMRVVEGWLCFSNTSDPSTVVWGSAFLLYLNVARAPV